MHIKTVFNSGLERSTVFDPAIAVDIGELRFQWRPDEARQSAEDCLDLYCLIGNAFDNFAWRGQEVAQPVGRIFMRPPGVHVTGAAASAADVRFLKCRFSSNWLQETVGDLVDWESLDTSSCLNIVNPDIERSIKRLAIEARHGSVASDLLIEALATTLCIDLTRHFNERSDRRLRPTVTQPAARVEKVRQIVALSETIPSPRELASELDLSVVHIRRLFRAETGDTLTNYLRDASISRACELLSHSDLGLKSIAYRAGFACHSAFSSAFRRAMGLTPSQFRALNSSG